MGGRHGFLVWSLVPKRVSVQSHRNGFKTHPCVVLTFFWNNLAGRGYTLSFKEEQRKQTNKQKTIKKNKINSDMRSCLGIIVWDLFRIMGFILYLYECLPSLTDCQSGDST